MLLCGIKDSLKSGLSKGPRPIIQGLLLTPDYVGDIWVLVEITPYKLPGKRMKLLDATNRGILDPMSLAIL